MLDKQKNELFIMIIMQEKQMEGIVETFMEYLIRNDVQIKLFLG